MRKKLKAVFDGLQKFAKTLLVLADAGQKVVALYEE